MPNSRSDLVGSIIDDGDLDPFVGIGYPNRFVQLHHYVSVEGMLQLVFLEVVCSISIFMDVSPPHIGGLGKLVFYKGYAWVQKAGEPVSVHRNDQPIWLENCRMRPHFTELQACTYGGTLMVGSSVAWNVRG